MKMIAMMKALACCLLVSFSTTVQAATTGQDVIDWLKTKPGAVVSDKMAYQDGKMVAVADIPKQTQLMVIPASAVVGDLDDVDVCATVQTMMDERNKGKQSDYYPYLDYLFGDEQKSRLLPSGWSLEGQKVLKAMLGKHLLPDEATAHTVRECRKELEDKGNDAKVEQQAYFVMMTHTSDEAMIPGACVDNVEKE